ncbi:flagellar hook-associated protein FlgK [Alkalicaulis satelles]|uniref:Flagellar hook-associated protein 1 n=1 Tax=Alkalicaulis satelles TaxID=2609175 RepID=A0A5M6ZBR7_9PROT|nr:flagellar hook-associated protein FlgK [Alkalicaulis satelles]KAA5802183.1 flagellar hook-associated protein FlgK [Alkalicaulis satelles]
MSLNGIIGSALSGLQAAQLGMRTSSNNVANVNTPGYARSELSQTSRSSGGMGAGVMVHGIQRVSDIYLTGAAMRAASDAAASKALAASLDRLQSQFGATDDPGSLFGRMNQIMASLGAAAADSADRVSRLSAASDIQSFFDEASRLSAEVRTMRDEADQRIGTGVFRINEIIKELQSLNAQAQTLTATASDTTGTLNRQAELMDELSNYIDVRGERQSDGRLFVRTQDGVSLLDNSRLELRYVPAGTGAYGVEYGRITAVVSASGAVADITPSIRSGELRGLLDLRDIELPAIAGGLAEMAAGAADALNAAHNDAASYPPPNALEGRNTGFLASDVLTGSGQASLAVVNASGELVTRVDVGVTGAGFTVNGAPAASIADLVNALNTEFGGAASASFVNGRLSLSAADPSHGLAALQDPDDPASIGGRGFAHMFGLNDLVGSPRPGFFETGLSAASPHGLNAGGELGFSIYTPDGRKAGEVSVPVTGASLQDQINALNSPAGGLGLYGQFSLDADGTLSFQPAPGYQNFKVELNRDSTERGATGLSFSQIFGMGDAARMTRAESFSVNPAVRADSSRLAFGKLDLNAASAPGDLVLSEGDSRGGQALFNALTEKRRYAGAGGLVGGMASPVEYASRLAGDVGARAARAERNEAAAMSVKKAADAKRSDVEGVNLDEELARMTLYQQAYNASARLLQASKEMTDTLLNMV